MAGLCVDMAMPRIFAQTGAGAAAGLADGTLSHLSRISTERESECANVDLKSHTHTHDSSKEDTWLFGRT